MAYRFVYFDNGSVKKGKIDKDNYFYICTEDLRKTKNIKVVSYPLDHMPDLLHKLYVLHNHPKLNKYINVPFKHKWFPFFFDEKFLTENTSNDDKICFITSGFYVTPDYIYYLKKKFPKAKFVLIHRDLISLWYKRNPLYTPELVHDLFDLELTYDRNEAAFYKIYYFSEIESKIAVPDFSSEKYSSDLFFAGYVKDRLPILLNIYSHAKAKGIRCDFYLVGVEINERTKYEGITYADKSLSYREMLKRSISSRCILEINQGGAVGYTSRFLEAIMYNRKLLTNNTSIPDSKFYNPSYIQCFNKVEMIDYDFILRDVGEIDYHYNNEFSPTHLIEQIEGLLDCEYSK